TDNSALVTVASNILDATSYIEQFQLLVLMDMLLLQSLIPVKCLILMSKCWVATLIAECVRCLLCRLPNRPIEWPGEGLWLGLSWCEHFYRYFTWLMMLSLHNVFSSNGAM